MNAGTSFSHRAEAYWLARGAYDAFRDQHDGTSEGYDEAVTPLVMAMHELAVGAVEAPSANHAEFASKVAIFVYEGLYDDGDRNRVRGLLDRIMSDIRNLEPQSYPKGDSE